MTSTDRSRSREGGREENIYFVCICLCVDVCAGAAVAPVMNVFKGSSYQDERWSGTLSALDVFLALSPSFPFLGFLSFFVCSFICSFPSFLSIGNTYDNDKSTFINH